MFRFNKLMNITRQISTTVSNNFRMTPTLLAEPLKKKKKLDPQIIRQREERRRKRIEKLIKKMEKGEKQFKPIAECDIPIEILDEKNIRYRKLEPLSEEEKDRRVRLFKQWAVYRHKCHLNDVKMCDRHVTSQQWALDQLKLESEELYNAAIQIDEKIIPFKSKGPVDTPPIQNYDSPDGEYTNISRKWDVLIPTVSVKKKSK